MFATLLSVLAPIPHIDVQQQSQTTGKPCNDATLYFGPGPLTVTLDSVPIFVFSMTILTWVCPT
jgi:hypothetical protein|eukprot:COSAG01_NODE_1893_length_8976_cov_21.264053_6_plen_64_part_00